MNNLSGFLSFHGNVSGQMGSNLITNVEANPSGTPTEILTSIRVGDVIYSIPSGGGGGGGTNNYNELLNKPKINNVVLSGELSLSDLGIYNPVVMTGATNSSDGAAGYAPKPLMGDEDKFLKGDGTWTEIPLEPAPVELYIKGFLVANPSDITLSDSFENYNYLYFYFIKRDDNSYYDYLPAVIYTKEELLDCMNSSISGRTNVLNISGWQPGNQYVRMTITNNTTLHIVRNDSNLLLHKITGKV